MLKLFNKRSFLHSSSSAAAALRESLSGGKSSLLTEAATGDFNLWRGLSTQSGLRHTTGPKFATNGDFGTRVYAPYSIFKGKAALSAEPVMSTFSKMESGYLKVERRGVIMLQFRPAIGERKYDSEKTQRFALSATEVGSMISLGPKDSCEFFHDPGMLSSNKGQVRKSLSIKAHADGSGYFFSLSVVNNTLGTNDRLVVPVTTAEFAVMKTAFTYALPHILGWNQITNQGNQIEGSQNSPKLVGKLVASEWER